MKTTADDTFTAAVKAAAPDLVQISYQNVALIIDRLMPERRPSWLMDRFEYATELRQTTEPDEEVFIAFTQLELVMLAKMIAQRSPDMPGDAGVAPGLKGGYCRSRYGHTLH